MLLGSAGQQERPNVQRTNSGLLERKDHVEQLGDEALVGRVLDEAVVLDVQVKVVQPPVQHCVVRPDVARVARAGDRFDRGLFICLVGVTRLQNQVAVGQDFKDCRGRAERDLLFAAVVAVTLEVFYACGFYAWQVCARVRREETARVEKVGPRGDFGGEFRVLLGP